MSHPRSGKSLFDDRLIITAHWKAFPDEVTCNLTFRIAYFYLFGFEDAKSTYLVSVIVWNIYFEFCSGN